MSYILPSVPPEWSRYGAHPTVRRGMPPELMAWTKQRAAQRWAAMATRYGGEVYLGHALRKVIVTLGTGGRVPDGREAWDVVQSWHAPLADWLHTIGGSADAWEPLAADVRQTERNAGRAARDIMAPLDAAQEAAENAGEDIRVSYAVPPQALAALRLCTGPEAYAYTALRIWRPRLQLAALELADVPEIMEEEEEEGRGLRAAPAPQPPEERQP